MTRTILAVCPGEVRGASALLGAVESGLGIAESRGSEQCHTDKKFDKRSG